MLWLALVLAAAALAWWWRAQGETRCRRCGSRAVFCTFPFVCAARRQGVAPGPADDDHGHTVPPPEETP